MTQLAIISEATFVLNPETANTSTYQTWVSVRLMEDRSLLRKTNASGNGQTWEVFGYVSQGETQLFSTGATEAQQARILAHVATKAARKCNVSGFGAAWSNATWVRPTVSTQTGRKLTAAPSIRLGQVDRDKNTDQMRIMVGGGFMERDGSVNPLMDAARKRNASQPRIVFYAPRITVKAGVEVNADQMRRLG